MGELTSPCGGAFLKDPFGRIATLAVSAVLASLVAGASIGTADSPPEPVTRLAVNHPAAALRIRVPDPSPGGAEAGLPASAPEARSLLQVVPTAGQRPRSEPAHDAPTVRLTVATLPSADQSPPASQPRAPAGEWKARGRREGRSAVVEPTKAAPSAAPKSTLSWAADPLDGEVVVADLETSASPVKHVPPEVDVALAPAGPSSAGKVFAPTTRLAAVTADNTVRRQTASTLVALRAVADEPVPQGPVAQGAMVAHPGEAAQANLNYAYDNHAPGPAYLGMGCGGNGCQCDQRQCNHACGHGCGSRYCCLLSTCDMIPHYAYYPALHGYYYFRPYNYMHVPRQQEFVTRFGGDARNPYANEIFKRVYAEYKAANPGAGSPTY